jgi:hypothetical protein
LCFPIFQKRLIILPSKRRPLRQKSGGGHSCCSDPNCSQLLQNSRRRLVGICGSRFSKKDSLFCLQKGGRFAKKAAAIVAVPIPIVLSLFMLAQKKLRGRKAEKGTERFYFLVPRIN